MGKKIKTEPTEDNTEIVSEAKEEELTYEEKVQNCSIIAKPMANKKLAKKCYKLIKKALKHKDYLRSGLHEVAKRIRKGEIGIVIFAGDVSPVDIMVHLPAVCEDKNIPYVYVPSRKDLGATMGVKRGCLMVLVREHDDYKEGFEELQSEIKHLAVEL